MARKLIIDTDPGVDDAMAIFYALNSPEFDVIGLTTVYGNVAAKLCTQNALRLLEVADRPDIPVAAGADHPLTMPFNGGVGFVHGDDGQGNANLPPPSTQPVSLHAAQFLIDAIQSFPGEITLVALGPLTNLALMLMLQPDIAPLIREIVLMGGAAFSLGNVTPAAEANIINDPEAADLVFGAACPVTMAGLDVTEKICMQPEHFDQIDRLDNPKARHLARILPFYRAFYRERYGRDEMHVHDSTTITYLLKPALFKTVQYPVRVDTSSGLSRGKTWPALGRSDKEIAWKGRPLVTICVEAVADAAIRLELECLARG